MAKFTKQADAFLKAYAHFVRDPVFYPSARDSTTEPDRFRVRQDNKAWFNTQTGAVWVLLTDSVYSELSRAGFLMLISSGDHFISDEGWNYIRSNLVNLQFHRE